MAQQGEVINHIYNGNEQASAELFDEAEMAYRRALSKAPEKPEALYNLGNTHFQEQDFDEAKQRFFQTQKFTLKLFILVGEACDGCSCTKSEFCGTWCSAGSFPWSGCAGLPCWWIPESTKQPCDCPSDCCEYEWRDIG